MICDDKYEVVNVLEESGRIRLFLTCNFERFPFPLFIFLFFQNIYSIVFLLVLVFTFESHVYMLSRGLLTAYAYMVYY